MKIWRVFFFFFLHVSVCKSVDVNVMHVDVNVICFLVWLLERKTPATTACHHFTSIAIDPRWSETITETFTWILFTWGNIHMHVPFFFKKITATHLSETLKAQSHRLWIRWSIVNSRSIEDPDPNWSDTTVTDVALIRTWLFVEI